jgi:DHA2 family multidrug resistance protein
MGPVDEMTKAIIAPLVQRAALTQSLNESWQILAALFALALLMVPAIRGQSTKSAKPSVDCAPEIKR